MITLAVVVVGLDTAFTRRVGRGPDFLEYAYIGCVAGLCGWVVSHL